MVYSEESSLRLASLTEDVPILECGGLDSFCQSAGWKLGWVLLFDRHKALERQVCKSHLITMDCVIVFVALQYIGNGFNGESIHAIARGSRSNTEWRGHFDVT